MPPTFLHHLTKRASIGGVDFDIPPFWIVVLIIIAAMCATLICYGLHRLIGFSDTTNYMRRPGTQQLAYLAEVRQRNLSTMEREAWRGRVRRDGGR